MIAVQTIFKGPDLAIATSILIFLQSLAGTVFLSVAQNVFEGKLQTVIKHDLPSVNPADVLGVGASDLAISLQKLYPDQLHAILDSYNEGLRAVFLISVIFTCASALSLPFMEWRNVKKKAAAKPAETSENEVDAEKST